MGLLVTVGLIGAVVAGAWGYALFFAALLVVAGTYALFLRRLGGQRRSNT
jgi:hypothetical protein